MRTIFVRVTNEGSPSYAPVLATSITSTTFSIEGAHPNFADVAVEFGAGDNLRCKVIRLRGPWLSRSHQLLKPALSR
jgi:hypothetical protein